MSFRLAQWLSGLLPPSGALQAAEWLADARFQRAPRERAVVEANLSLILGNTRTVTPALVREVFRNFGRYLVEFFAIHRVPHPQVRVEGYRHFHAAFERRRGIITLTAHIGNWELGAILMRRMGFPVAAVALPHGDRATDGLFNRQRRRCGITVIPLGAQAAHRSLEHLRRGHLLGLLGDREFAGSGLRLPVWGQEMTVPRGPAMLSLRSQAPVVPTFLIREGPWKFTLVFEPPVWPPAHGARRGAVPELTKTYAAVLERYVRRFPDQWLMFQPIAGAG